MSRVGILGNIAVFCEEAASGLLARRQRTALALIGIVIGTAAVVGTIIIGHNARTEAARVFRGLGIDTLVAQPTTARTADWGKSASIVRRIPPIDRVAPAMSGQAEVFGERAHKTVPVLAVGPSFDSLAGVEILSGRPLLPIDDALPTAVVGSNLAAALSAPGAPIEPGAKVRIGSYAFTVVGVLRAERVNPLLPMPLGDGVLVSRANARRVMAVPAVNLLIFHGRDLRDPQPVADAVTQDFMVEQQVPITVQTARQMVDAQRQQQAVIGRLLAAIGIISLVVGGIGVTNVMLMGLMERRAEFGLRMAVGATPTNIMLAVLIEGALLGLIGGLAGTVLGVAAAAGFARYSGWMFTAPAAQLPIGAALSTLMGILFGLYPAFQAARLDPVVALRAE